MALPRNYKFHFVNNLGVDMDLSSNSANETITLTLRHLKYDSSGALEYAGSETSLTYSAADVADGGSAEFTAQANNTDLFVAADCEVQVVTDDATAAGYVDIYWEWATDGGTTFPSDAAQFDPEQDLQPLASVRIDGADARTVPFRI